MLADGLHANGDILYHVAALVVTDWPEISELDWVFDAIATPVVIDD